MSRSRNALLALLRGGALGAALIALHVVDDWALRGAHVGLARALLAAIVLGAAALVLGVELLLPRSLRTRPVLPLLLLAVDLVLLGTVGTYLRVADGPAIAAIPSLPFLAGYLIAALVAVTGRRAAAAALGVLAGTMLLLLGESGTMRQRPLAGDPAIAHPAARGASSGLSDGAGSAAARAADPDPSGPTDSRDLYLLLRLLLISVAALECAAVTGWIDQEMRRRRTAETVDRELRAREEIAGELATFVAAAKSAGSLRELGEALVAHLRRHFTTGARAVFLEDAGERLAVWEEVGRLDERLAEQRRLRLQEAVRDAGSSALVPRVETRSAGGLTPGAGASSMGIPRSDRLLTGIEVAIHATGRVGGVIFVGDTRRDALHVDRLGALAELARQAGDAMRRLERSRDEQTRRTSLLLEQMREGVLLVGSDGRVSLSNPAGREMMRCLAQEPDEPLSLGEVHASELAAIPTGTARRWAITANVEGGRAIRLAVAAVGVADAGTRLGTIVTLADVTEEEHARRRLMQSEKMSVVGQTLASVAHELNNPLAAIVGYADLLAEAHVPPDIERLLVRIREQATRTSRIVKNLLNVARRRGPERVRVTLNEIATSVTDLFAYEARISDITLTAALDKELPPVLADRHALQQILVNLVQNAIQALRHTGRGGRIEVRSWKEASSVCVAVRDDGPGIPPETRARLFEAFFTTKGSDEGTGLGLTISRTIAREHGGDLTLEEQVDATSGTQFTLRLPLERNALAAPPAAKRKIPDGVPARVLVIDDEAPVRDSLLATLEHLGAQVDGAASPGEADRMVATGAPYDAVLLDVRMPGRSGIEFHRELRTKNPQLASRVVFMTGDLVNDDVLRAVKATGNPFLEKPFTAEELREVLGRAATCGRM